MVLAMQILLLCVCEYKFDHGLAPMMMGSGDKERLPLMPYNITIYADLEYTIRDYFLVSLFTGARRANVLPESVR